VGLYFRLIDEGAIHGLPAMTFGYLSEPLLRPDIADLTAHARAHPLAGRRCRAAASSGISCPRSALSAASENSDSPSLTATAMVVAATAAAADGPPTAGAARQKQGPGACRPGLDSRLALLQPVAKSRSMRSADRSFTGTDRTSLAVEPQGCKFRCL
jgi:hypothetical protein